jgi:hypothetical protein
MTPIETLVLLAVATFADSTAAELRKKIDRLAGERARGIEDMLAGLQARELVAVGEAKRGGRSPRFQLTDAGREAVMKFHPTPLPRRGWASAVARLFQTRAVGARPATRLDADRFRAAVIDRAFGLGLTNPTLPAARDALAWKLSGLGGTGAFTTGSLFQLLFERELGTTVRGTDAALSLLAARALGARRAGADELLLAPLRSWLDSQPTPPPAEPDDQAAFVARVLDAARAADAAGRFGEDKVFISHVWRKTGDGELAAFKERLLAAQRAGLVTLTRADLVAAMDPRDVAESEISYRGSSFHFLRV